MGIVVCVDIGNVNIRTGFFNEGKLLKAFVGLPEFEDIQEARAVVYSSVSNRNYRKFMRRLKEFRYSGMVLRLSATSQQFLRVHYTNPSQLGDDRLALAYFIWRRYGHGIGIDAGTFINIEWVKEVTHYPLTIFPGLNILVGNYKKGSRLRDYASLIMDEIKGRARVLDADTKVSGISSFPLSTIDCIVKGLIDAIKGLVDGAIGLVGEEKIIFTGGDGLVLKNLLAVGEYEEYAVLWGLYYFFELLESSSKI